MCVLPRPERPTRPLLGRPTRRAALASALGLAGTLAACAGGGGDVTGTTSPPPPPPPPPSPSSSLALAAAPAAVRVQAGQSGAVTVRLTRGGPAAAVVLAAEVGGAPSGVAAAFAPATVPADGAESAVTLTTTAATPAGDYTVTISGSGGANASTSVTLHVDPAPVARYTLAVTPTPVAVTAGAAAASATVTLARSNFAGAVTLAAAGAPAGLTVTLPAAPVAGESAALGVQAAATVPAGDYPVTLTGSAAGLAPVTATVVVRVAAAAPPPQPTPPSTGVTPGYVTGTVVDAAGRPLAGVEVYADNTLYYNTNVIGYTDAQGRYKLDVRQPIGTWRVGAHLTREYNGRTYQLDLHPDTARAFSGADGAVRNFDWRLTGRTPEGGSYGVATYVYLNWAPGEYVSVGDVEVTFTPVGPLVDGSTGQVGVVRLQGNYVSNIPLGRYKVTARWAPQDGRAPRPMGVRLRDANNYTESTTLDWPANGDGRPQEAEIEVYLPARTN